MTGTTAPETIVVTGAARGIGRACALELRQRGYRVLYVDRELSAAEAAAADVARGESLALSLDVTDGASVNDAFASIADRVGPVSGLVNNVGLPSRAVTAELADDEWRRLISVNLDSVLYCSRAVRAQLAQTGGSIVNMSSISGLRGMAERAAYVASKTAVIGLTRALAAEWGVEGIRVNAVAPGYVRTEGFEERMTSARGAEIVGWLEEEIPLGRLCTPEEIARAVCFLIGPDASYVTGHTLVVDGGVTSRVRG